MNNVFIISDDQYTEHKTGYRHPEAPDRTLFIENALKSSAHLSNIKFIKPKCASEQDLLLCHTAQYINIVEEEVFQADPFGDSFLSTGDVQICPVSFNIAKLAAGGVIAGIDLLLKENAKRVFCNVRPPGHHACPSAGMGFCIFNNAAIGARYAQRSYGIEKIMIIDWDVHHGNGTQEIFYEDPSVFYFSTHQEGIYPFTGLREEIGKNNGEGANLNIPIKGCVGARQSVIDAFHDYLIPAANFFKPELIVISAGFDAHKNDPLGGLDLETEDFSELTLIATEIAKKHCNGKVLSVLEGGYNLSAIAESVVAHIHSLRP